MERNATEGLLRTARRAGHIDSKAATTTTPMLATIDGHTWETGAALRPIPVDNTRQLQRPTSRPSGRPNAIDAIPIATACHRADAIT